MYGIMAEVTVTWKKATLVMYVPTVGSCFPFRIEIGRPGNHKHLPASNGIDLAVKQAGGDHQLLDSVQEVT